MSVTSLGMPSVRPVHGQGNLHAQVAFPKAAKKELQNEQMRANIRHATHTIRAKRAGVVGEVPDWSELRDAGSAIKETVMARLPELLEQFEIDVKIAFLNEISKKMFTWLNQRVLRIRSILHLWIKASIS